MTKMILVPIFIQILDHIVIPIVILITWTQASYMQA